MIDKRGRRVLDYSELTPKQLEYFLKFLWNGVGSREFIKPPQLIYKEASKIHDFKYFLGGNDEDRKAADKEFLHKAHDAVRAQKAFILRPFYYVTSYVYFYTLKKLGAKAWEYYPAPAKDWKEFLQHYYTYYSRIKKPLPHPTWAEWLKINK